MSVPGGSGSCIGDACWTVAYWRALLADTVTTQTERARAEAVAGDYNGFYAAVKRSNSAEFEFTQIADSYGLDVCGRSS